jgi:hypothetical protein
MVTKETKAILKPIFGCLNIVIAIFFFDSCDTAGPNSSGWNPASPTCDLSNIQINEAPQLISPENGAVLDNGRTDKLDEIIWDFGWSEVTNAVSYNIYVIHQGAQYPVINDLVYHSSYHSESIAYITNENRHDWKWKVRGGRANCSGSYIFGPWSEERTFDVELVNTDPPSNR